MISIELLILVVMLGTFIALLLGAKWPSGLSLMVASVVGWILSAIIQHTGLELRYLVEGGFGYIDNLLVIVCAMVFIKGLEASGALDYISALLVKIFHKFPTILLLAFMALVMLPGMVTGSSTAGVVSAGVIVTPIMLNMGIPKKKVAGFVGMGAVLGMVAPPINIPVMVICDVVDIAYSGFDIPLLLMTVPMAVLSVIFFSREITFKKANNKENKNILENIIISAILGLVIVFFLIKFLSVGSGATEKQTNLALWLLILVSVVSVICIIATWIFAPHCKEIDLEHIKESVNFNIFKEINFTCLIPLLVIVLLFVAQSIWPKEIGTLATPLLFIIAFISGLIISLFSKRRINAIKVVDDAVKNSLGVLGLLMGVGMFIEIMTLSGARGYIVINVLSLMSVSKPLIFVALAVSMTLFGGISSFGSASIFGGPFVMALYSSLNFIIIASACSLVAALGEFLPPTAMSSRLATKNINDIKLEGEEDIGYMSVTKNAAIPLAATLIWAMVFIIVVGKYYG